MSKIPYLILERNEIVTMDKIGNLVASYKGEDGKVIIARYGVNKWTLKRMLAKAQGGK
jgi:hypothetical protein